MSSNATGWITKDPLQAYPREQREAHAESHLLVAAAAGFLGQTSCTHIARTYGILDSLTDLKRLKAQLFPEFACGGDK